ncbi:MAG: diadenosine tetraphosphate hydrolase [Planctomyces sp.]|nr:diadenosine tetraphosphate hydrolase [Planctomyces sp.]MBA4119904.1 diadenosine tetraphosphate hydrolase [Isosphaera sp.]
MPETIFDKIIRGQIPCHRVYDDAFTLAFLDINPIAPGHTLVIPKHAAVTLGELDDESAAAIGRVLPRICRAVCAATGASQYNVLQNNGPLAHQAVMHVHFHVIPRNPRGEHRDEAGLGVRWNATAIDHAMAGQLAARMRSLLSP